MIGEPLAKRQRTAVYSPCVVLQRPFFEKFEKSVAVWTSIRAFYRIIQTLSISVWIHWYHIARASSETIKRSLECLSRRFSLPKERRRFFSNISKKDRSQILLPARIIIARLLYQEIQRDGWGGSGLQKPYHTTPQHHSTKNLRTVTFNKLVRKIKNMSGINEKCKNK